MKNTTFANSPSGFVMDPNQMTGAQRAAFLPASTSFVAPTQAGLEPAGGGGGGRQQANAPGMRPNFVGVPGQGGSSDPDERPDWFNSNTTSAAGQQAKREQYRQEIERRAQEDMLLQLGADPLAVYGGRGAVAGGRR